MMSLSNLIISNNIPDYKKVMNTEKFNTGLKKVFNSIKEGNTIVLMCTEKNPIECHRFNLISRSLKKMKINVLHIMEDGNLKKNEKVEEELIKEFMKDYYNLTLFNEPISKEKALEKAYDFANRKIADEGK